jgi:hypothetical protein
LIQQTSDIYPLVAASFCIAERILDKINPIPQLTRNNSGATRQIVFFVNLFSVAKSKYESCDACGGRSHRLKLAGATRLQRH